MAIEDNSLRGKIGPMVCYRMNGKNITRGMPCHYEQTPATKARGLNFGVASRVGAQIRSGLKDIIPFPKDLGMQSSLTGTISRWLARVPLAEVQPVDDIPYLSDFRFNWKSMVNMKWRALLHISMPDTLKLLLDIHAFIPKDVTHAPAWTEKIECKLAVVSCNLATQRLKSEFHASIQFPLDRNEVPTQQIVLPVSIEPGNLVLVVAAMIYTLNKGGESFETKEIAFRPADVIWARYF